MWKKTLTSFLLMGLLAMNLAFFCKSLCLSEHYKMSHMPRSGIPHAMDQKGIAGGEECPLHKAVHQNSTHAQHPFPESSIKCGCSVEDEINLGGELILTKTEIPGPYMTVISSVRFIKPMVKTLSFEPPESPPEVLS